MNFSINNKNNSSRCFLKKTIGGFTMIELIVVIAIISILSTIVMAAITSVRKKANDSARKTELIELQKAITHYFTTTGSYPMTGPVGGPWVWYSSETGDSYPDNSGNYVPNIVAAQMISAIPKDPVGGKNPVDCNVSGDSRAYLYRSNGQHYKLLSNCALESDSYPSPGAAFYDPYRPGWALMVTDNIQYTGTNCPSTTCW